MRGWLSEEGAGSRMRPWERVGQGLSLDSRKALAPLSSKLDWVGVAYFKGGSAVPRDVGTCKQNGHRRLEWQGGQCVVSIRPSILQRVKQGCGMEVLCLGESRKRPAPGGRLDKHPPPQQSLVGRPHSPPLWAVSSSWEGAELEPLRPTCSGAAPWEGGDEGRGLQLALCFS